MTAINEFRARHRFTNSINGKIKGLYALDNWHGPLALAMIYAVMAASILAPRALAPILGWWPVYVASVVVIGCMMRALATVLHESSHKILARSRWLNHFLGTFCSGYLIVQSWHPYFVSHVLGHHARLGDEDHDPDYRFHLRQGLYETTSPVRFALLNFVAPLFLIKTPAKVLDLLRNRFFAGDEPRRERIVKLAYIGSVVGLISAAGYGEQLVLFWIVPLVTVFPTVNWYNEFFEHYPFVHIHDIDIHMSRNRWPGPVAKFLTCLLNENFHQVHHLKPGVPFWNLPKAHQVLMEDETYRRLQQREIGLVIPIVAGIPSVVMNIVGLMGRRFHG